MINAIPASEPFHLSDFQKSQSVLATNFDTTRMFASPQPAGRRITAGFSWMQRIGKSATTDLWFPSALHNKLDLLLKDGVTIGQQYFPAEWAAVRQFELLQDAGNYKIYNMQADYMMRSLYELTRGMRGGGYRVTIVTLGGYSGDGGRDELEILDRRLQERLSQIIHMLYLDEQSAEINTSNDSDLAEGRWNFRDALPHVGMTLGARNLFRPVGGGIRPAHEVVVVPYAPHRVAMTGWVANLGVSDAITGEELRYTGAAPQTGEYSFRQGVYEFARADEGRSVEIGYMRQPLDGDRPSERTSSERRHMLAQKFFNLLELLPHNHIVHDTAVGLQLPEMINEEEWLYVPASDESVQAFNVLLRDVFAPLDMMSLSKLDGREDAKSEIKSTVQHMQGYGDRLTPESENYRRQLAHFTLGL
jgi:hypothetical protein